MKSSRLAQQRGNKPPRSSTALLKAVLRRGTGIILQSTALVLLAGCAARNGGAPATPAQKDNRVDVTFVTDEADAALSIIRTNAPGNTPSPNQWSTLFRSQGYTHLKEREAAMGRAFSDSSFRAFLTADSVSSRLREIERAVPVLERTDLGAASKLALAYLPPGTSLRARLYLEIKPITNSFVFTGRDSIPSIFLYLQTDETAAQLRNTLAHELHHIGNEAACRGTPGVDSARTTPAYRMLLDYLSAFGEGRAMLAAAGGPDVHPHANDADSIRARWDRDVAHAPADVNELSGFMAEVIAGRISWADSVRRRGNSYFGVQGPWYTVGWLMASTVERKLGRTALIQTLCDPVSFLAQYNRAAQQSNTDRRTPLPLWPTRLIDDLSKLAHPAVQ